MISLSDDELTVITDLARPLPPDQRSRFLEAVIAEASKHVEVGPGLISRIARAVQTTYFFSMPREPGGATRQQARRR
jgi:hypothetical protein